jgi:tyrosinase
VARESSADFNALIESDRSTERIFVRVNFAQLPPANDFFVRVFLNLPDANAQTPTDDAHYAGSFAFFGTDTAGHGKMDFLVSVSETLQNLTRQAQLAAGAPLSVQLVAVPANQEFSSAGTELTLEQVEFIVTPVIVRSQ